MGIISVITGYFTYFKYILLNIVTLTLFFLQFGTAKNHARFGVKLFPHVGHVFCCCFFMQETYFPQVTYMYYACLYFIQVKYFCELRMLCRLTLFLGGPSADYHLQHILISWVSYRALQAQILISHFEYLVRNKVHSALRSYR